MWQQKFLTWLGLTNQTVVRVYRSYGRPDRLMVQGHVLRHSPLPRTSHRRAVLANIFAILRLFMVKPYANVTVQVEGYDKFVQTDHTGFFHFDIEPGQAFSPGWHTIRVRALTGPAASDRAIATGEGKILIPFATSYGCISDIDDTFLISHSATILKRLRVLLTQNAESRQPFEGVVEHYKLLAQAGTTTQTDNPFFYVSSSEWNLYDYILAFSQKHGLPEGVYMLNQLKQLTQLHQTGQNKHMTKFTRIARILETYPEQRFILLGDDSQEDPTIYASLVGHFGPQILCVYLRRINSAKLQATEARVAEIKQAGVPCCYFTHSAEARRHSEQLGLGTPA